MSIGAGAGDEVITTPFTFFATASAIVRLGARPVFVDIDERNFNINPSLVAEKITTRTKAIVPVHMYGQCPEMDPLTEISARHGIPIIEEPAQAIGAENPRRRAAPICTITCFPLSPPTNLT